MVKRQDKKLKDNGTALNLNASELLEMDLNEVIKLDNARLNNIGNGSR